MSGSRSAIRPLLLAVVVLVGAWPACALAGTGALDGLAKRLWEVKDGLPDQTINALAQTPDGSLWIGTGGGLVRFDGVHFTSYSRNDVPDGIDRGTNALCVTRDGDLWIGTEGEGVIRYHDHHFVRYPIRHGPGSLFVRSIYQDRAGTLWVGSDQGLFRLEGQTLIRIDNRPGFPAVFVRSILEDGQGHLWIGGTMLLELSGDTVLRTYALPDGKTKNAIRAMYFARDGSLWLGLLSGLYTLRRDGQLVRAFQHTEPVYAITQSADGRIWIGSAGMGLDYVEGARLEHVPLGELPSRTVLALFEDRNGNLWLGTKAGLVRLSPTAVAILTFPGGVDAEFETLYVDRDQSVWVAASTHLFHIRNNIPSAYEFPGLHGVRVRTLLRSRNGDLWIGTDGAGLFHLGQGAIRRYSTGHGLCNDFVRAIVEDRDGTIWAGTDGGLTHITPAGSRNYGPTNGLAYFSINALYEDRAGNIWVGTSRGLSQLTGGRIVRSAVLTALAQEEVFGLAQDAAGVLWIGTSNGLYGVRNGSLIHLTVANGLPSNRILQILPDGNGSFWLSSPSSVSRLRASDLDQARPDTQLEPTAYEDASSLQSTVLYRGMQPEGGIAANGDVWFASSKGALRIVPSKIAVSAPAPVTIEAARADDQLLSLGPRLVLKPQNSRLEISYAGVHLDAQGGLRYRYRMEGLEPWIDAGMRRTAYYTHIPPGQYRFRVQCYQLGNPAQISEASIVVVQEPPLYRTPWFLVLCVLTLLAAVFSVHRYRLHQMRRQFQAVNAERNRLAREMHDTLIQGCVGVSTLLEAAQGLDAADESLRQHLLGYATEQVRTTIEAARGAVWALRNVAASNGNLGEHCQELVHRMQLESDIPIHCEIHGEPFHMGEDATHELLMTIKEALTNALTHSGATAIHLKVVFAEREVEVEIADNGRGFPPEAIGAMKGHYGMIGMTERIQLLGGTLTIDSAEKQGTTIRLKVPRTNEVL